MPRKSVARVCADDDCDKPVRGKGKCIKHYMRDYRGSAYKGGEYGRNGSTCKTVGCQRKPLPRNMCSTCYSRWLRRQRRQLTSR